MGWLKRQLLEKECCAFAVSKATANTLFLLLLKIVAVGQVLVLLLL